MTGKQNVAPLSVGNTVSLAVRIWRSKLKTFFWIGIRAYLWFLLLAVGWFLVFYAALFTSVIGGLATLDEEIPPVVQALATLGPGLWLLSLVLFPLFLFGFAKFLSLSGLLSRLAYQEISGQPESEKVALDQIKPKLWSYLLIAFLNGLILGGVYIVTVILAAIVIFIVGLIVGVTSGGSGEPSLVAMLLLVPLTIVLIVGVVLLPLAWVTTRLMLSEVPISVESSLSAPDSLGRSWQLTKGSFGRLVLVGLVAFLLTIPVQIILGYIPQIPFAIATAAVGTSSGAYWILQALSFLVSMATSLLSGAFLLPFWQSLKAVIYFDLRNRREGLGLSLTST